MKGDRVFVDTNIFVYAKLLDEQDRQRHRVAVELLSMTAGQVVISSQVLNEFSSVLLKHDVDDETVHTAVQSIAEGCTVGAVSLTTVEIVWDIRQKYKFFYWDCLILGSALENRCPVIYSEDFQHDQIIEGELRIVNPFEVV